MASKNAQIVQLSTELDKTIALVVHARESLTNELDSEWAQKKLSVDDKFLKKLKELTASFNSLTESKIRLDKATKAVERDLTPAEEREAVVGYLADLEPWDLIQLVKQAKAIRDGVEFVYSPTPTGKTDE
jgi:uncharacterized protein YdcH (DUF465 family)